MLRDHSNFPRQVIPRLTVKASERASFHTASYVAPACSKDFKLVKTGTMRRYETTSYCSAAGSPKHEEQQWQGTRHGVTC